MDESGTLHVALHEGFDGRAVVLRVDGVELYRAQDVWTDPRIGLAGTAELAWTKPPALLEVLLPEEGVSASTPLSPWAPFVGVSVVEGTIHFQLSEGPFGYA